MDTDEVQRAHASPGVTSHDSAADRVYAYAKTAVLSRRYAPHDLITEGELADAVGVSRTPVREALLRLQAEGLVRLLPKRGAMVMPVTAAEVADLLETRRLLESFAVRRAVAAAARPEFVAALEQQLEAMQRATTARDAHAYVEADREFHAQLVAATGNEIINGVYRSLRDRQLRMGVVNLLGPTSSADVGRMRAMTADHRRILEAVRARTVRAAEAAVTEHLDHAEQLLSRPR
jgi:DNA-binding GntR family transcriptional regulator